MVTRSENHPAKPKHETDNPVIGPGKQVPNIHFIDGCVFMLRSVFIWITFCDIDTPWLCEWVTYVLKRTTWENTSHEIWLL